MYRHHTLCVLSLIELTSFMASCTSEVASSDPATEIVATPIVGNDIYASDCGPGARAVLDKAMLYGRATANSRAFAQCMKNAMTSTVTVGGASFGPYRECHRRAQDPFAGETSATQLAAAMAITHTTADITMNCTGGGWMASTYLGTYGTNSPETLSFAGWLEGVYNSLGQPLCNGSTASNCRYAPDPWPYSTAASLVWHEQSHTQGYTHGANDQASAADECGYVNDPTWNFQFNTMPYIIGDCMGYVIAQSGTTCGNLDSCGPGRVKLIDGLDSSSCMCVPDPRGCLGAFGNVTTISATAETSSGDHVYIDNPFSNDTPSAVVTASSVWWTPAFGGSGVYNNHPIGVYYEPAKKQWAVFNTDHAAMPAAAAFNIEVDVGSPVIASAGNIAWNTMTVDDARINNNPHATVLVTPNRTPGGGSGLAASGAIGIYYSAPYWRVFHQDGSAMQVGEAFNLRVDACAEAVTANAGNSISDYVETNSALGDRNPQALVFATANWNPDARSGVYDRKPIGVYYDPSLAEWTVYHQDGSPIAPGASYNVLARKKGGFAASSGWPGILAAAFADHSSGPNCFGSFNDYGPWQVCPSGSHIASAGCQMAAGSNGTCSVTSQTATSAGIRVTAFNNCFLGAQAHLVVTCIAN